MARMIDADAAIAYLENHKKVAKENGYILAADEDAIIKFLNEKCPTLTPPNEPLTIEQLREMDGQPVYVVPENEHSELGGWCVIDIFDSDEYSAALVPGVDYWSWHFTSYGDQWLAYRRPPANAGSDPDPVGKGL